MSAELATPLVQKVVQRVREDIASGEYAPHQRLNPERLMCRKYGVSRPTLRAALARLAKEGLVLRHQNRGVQVAPEAKQRLRSDVKRRIVFIQRADSYEWLEITKGLRRFAAEHPGIEIQVIDVGGSHERCQDAIQQFTSASDGIFTRVYPCYEPILNNAIANGQSVVSWGRRNPLPNYSSIAVDEQAAGYSAADHLIRTHGIPVHHVALDTPDSATYGRSRGWAAAMRDHGFLNYHDYFIPIDLTEDEAVTDYDKLRRHEHSVMLKFFRTVPQEKYCIFAMGDFTATSVYHAAQEVGLDVRHQVFVVGFNNRPLCLRLDPTLSSVDYSAQEIGYQGANLLLDHMTGKLTRPLHKVLPVSLVVRASSTGSLQPVQVGGAS